MNSGRLSALMENPAASRTKVLYRLGLVQTI